MFRNCIAATSHAAQYDVMDERVARAAGNNARWCQAMCAAHNIETQLGSQLWTSRHRTPMYYPDAITLTPTVTAEQSLAEIDDSVGCCVKDSLDYLDFTTSGFISLVAAQWVHARLTRRPTVPAGETWRIVRTAEELAQWERGFAGDDDPVELFVPALLENRDVAVIAGYRNDRLIGGAVANYAQDAIGVSNMFDLRLDPESTWDGVISVAAAHFDVDEIFGYEHSHKLAVARSWGFEGIGKLRIWWRTA